MTIPVLRVVQQTGNPRKSGKTISSRFSRVLIFAIFTALMFITSGDAYASSSIDQDMVVADLCIYAAGRLRPEG
jgi:hypothetical protein